jgi:transposase-like protein
MSGTLSLRAFNALFPDEDSARGWFERARWPHGPECPGCGGVNRAHWLKSRRVWHCMDCRHQFTVTAGTPMHRTRVPLLSWLQAIYLIVASSKGISAVKLAEMLDVSYPTAWFMGHRIRAMMAEANPILSGVVELDEMYAGAPPRKRAKPARDHDDQGPPKNPQGRGTKRPLVLVGAERGGKVVAKVIPTHGREAIASALDGVLSPDAVVMTDGLPAYKHIGKTQTHLAVNHSGREYARTDPATGQRVHVNRVESFNGFMRRAVVGVWHQISVKHLGRYASEATFRWNRKKDDVLDRMGAMVRNGEGRLLSYAFLTAKGAKAA